MSDPRRATAIRALGALPLASELVGLALDFATDLRCSKATYFDAVHGIDWKLRCYHGEPCSLQCCAVAREARVCVCVECTHGMWSCIMCATTLCEDCNDIKFRCGTCGWSKALCETHMPHGAWSNGWMECILCHKPECFRCVTERTVPGVCNECTVSRRASGGTGPVAD